MSSRQYGRDPGEASIHRDAATPRGPSWHEVLGLHPEDDREVIIAALEDAASHGERWYEMIGVSPSATRRQIVEALNREYDTSGDQVADEIAHVVRAEYCDGARSRRRVFRR